MFILLLMAQANIEWSFLMISRARFARAEWYNCTISLSLALALSEYVVYLAGLACSLALHASDRSPPIRSLWPKLAPRTHVTCSGVSDTYAFIQTHTHTHLHVLDTSDNDPTQRVYILSGGV